MNIKHFFDKHFVIFTSRNRPAISGRFSYGKISIWPRTIIGWALTILLFIAIIFSLKLTFGYGSRQAIGFSNYNISNQWNCKFHYLNGGIQGGFTAKNENAQLIHSSNIENGTVVFQLYNSKGNLLSSFFANNTTDTIKDVFEKGERYSVRATAAKAKGHFDFKLE